MLCLYEINYIGYEAGLYSVTESACDCVIGAPKNMGFVVFFGFQTFYFQVRMMLVLILILQEMFLSH